MTQDTHTSGAAGLPEALRSIQRFEVVDCIDDNHVPAVIPKPHGPWVRYEDHVAALAAGQAMWRHIETAPKDGQAILVTDGMDCYCVEWDEEFDWWTVDDNKLGPFRLRGSAPTHWMPTPAAPGPADGERNG